MTAILDIGKVSAVTNSIATLLQQDSANESVGRSTNQGPDLAKSVGALQDRNVQ